MRRRTTFFFADAYITGDPGLPGALAEYVRRGAPATVLLPDPYDRLLLALEAASAREADAPVVEGARVSEVANDRRFRATTGRVVVSAVRSIAAELTEAGVSAVSIQGYDRGLILAEPEGGPPRLGDWDWLIELASLGGVPVVSPLARAPSFDTGDYVTQSNLLRSIRLHFSPDDVDCVVIEGRRAAADARVDRSRSGAAALGVPTTTLAGLRSGAPEPARRV